MTGEGTTSGFVGINSEALGKLLSLSLKAWFVNERETISTTEHYCENLNSVTSINHPAQYLVVMGAQTSWFLSLVPFSHWRTQRHEIRRVISELQGQTQMWSLTPIPFAKPQTSVISLIHFLTSFQVQRNRTILHRSIIEVIATRGMIFLQKHHACYGENCIYLTREAQLSLVTVPPKRKSQWEGELVTRTSRTVTTKTSLCQAHNVWCYDTWWVTSDVRNYATRFAGAKPHSSPGCAASELHKWLNTK